MTGNSYTKRILLLIFAITAAVTLFIMIKRNVDVPYTGKKPNNTEVLQDDRKNADTEKKIDALSYQMNLFLDTESDCLDEVVTMEIQNNTDTAISELCIRNMNPAFLKYSKDNYGEANQNKNSEITSITLKDSNERINVRYTDENTTLYVNLGQENTVYPGEIVSLTMKLKTDIPDRPDRFAVQKTQKGKIYTISFCFPYLADNVDGVWLLDPFFDDGESRSHDLADYSVTFEAPESYNVAATGVNKTENGKTTILAKNARDFAIVACDFMEMETFEVDGVIINNYYLDGKYVEEYKRLSKMIAKDSVQIFSSQVGKCLYDEIDVVPCLFGFAFGGMEYPGLVMINASSFFAGEFYDGWALSETISHEIAHQWFYASVGNMEYREGWIDEGFATYLERDVFALTECETYTYLLETDELFPSIESNIRFRDEQIENARKDYKNIYLNVSPDDYPKEQFYSQAEYEGSYMFLQEVRLQLGDEMFKKFLMDFYATYTMKVVDTEEVLEFIRGYDNSEKMEEIIGFYFKLDL